MRAGWLGRGAVGVALWAGVFVCMSSVRAQDAAPRVDPFAPADSVPVADERPAVETKPADKAPAPAARAKESATKPAQAPKVAPAKPAAPAAKPNVVQQIFQGVFRAQAIPVAAPARAMKLGAPASADGRNSNVNVLAPPDRSLLLLLSKAKQFSQQGRDSEAIRALGTILESPEDYFYRPSVDSKVLPSLRSEAERLLRSMPRQTREQYELQYGARARQMLEAALASGQPNDLAIVSRRYFHTRAGNEATLLLGFCHLDGGSPLAAARTLARLRDEAFDSSRFEPELSMALAACWQRAGATDAAKAVLDKAVAQYGDKLVRIGAQTIPLRDAARQVAALPRLAGALAEAGGAWLMFQGNAARNAASRSGGPLLSLAWAVRTTDRPELEAALEQIQDSFRDRDQWAIPALHPLVVGDVILMRTARNLLAIDGITGKMIWEAPSDDPFEPPSDPNADQSQMYSPVPNDRNAQLRIRMWGDATYGTLSSDGKRVFAVEDLSLNVHGGMINVMFAGRPPSPNDPKPYNRLAAYDIGAPPNKGGKLVWHAGGSPDEYNLAAMGTFFLGAPLPLGGQLYVLGEARGEIRLYALDARNGRLLWSQPLAVVEQERETLVDPVRRVSGVSPSFADGVLVCPTSNRSVVAVDQATRSLLWGYTYSPGGNQPQGAMGFNPMMARDADPAERWSNAAVTLADGMALITPADSGEIHCVRLRDGHPMWQASRERDLYLACVHRGAAILVGRRSMRALRLADGQPAWDGRQVDFEAAFPSGYGFHNDDLYYVPLSSGEVAAVDLARGQIVHRFVSRRGIVPGNLIVYKDKILSQRAGSLDAFYQLDSLKARVQEKLSKQPDDPVALLHRGEILWDEGKLDDAIASLRRSFERSATPGARNLLREALLDGLTNDFVRFQARHEEIQKLLDEPQHLSTFQRLLAVGRRQSGDFRGALESCLRYVDMDYDRAKLESIEKNRSIRRDRWASLELATLAQAAPPDVRAAIEKTLGDRRQAALAEGSLEAAQKFLAFFGELPGAAPARAASAQKLQQAQRLVLAELLLRRIERLSAKPQAAAAAGEVALLLKQAGTPEDAGLAYRRLAETYADTVCAGGKTGKQMLADLDPKDPAVLALKPDADWPRKHIVPRRQQQTAPQQPIYGLLAIPMIGPRPASVAETVLEFQQHPQAVQARDGWGEIRWQIKSAEWFRQGPGINPYMWRAAVREHLTVLSLGSKLVAIDTLGKGGGTAQTLWVRDLEELNRSGKRVVNAGRRNMSYISYSPYGMPGQLPTNAPVIIHEGLVCAAHQRSVFGVDLFTGEVQWMRDDAVAGSALVGDEACLAVVPPDGQTPALLLRPSDGAMLGKRTVPPNRLMAVGHNVVVWTHDGMNSVLECLDLLTQKTVWKSRPLRCVMPMGVDIVAGSHIGVVESTGRFSLLNAADGKPVFDVPLRPEQTYSDIHVLCYPDSYLLVVNGLPRPNVARPPIFHSYGMSSIQISKANIWGFDKSGKKLWEEPAVVEDQCLMQSQPAKAPLVVFACGKQEQQANGATVARTAVLGLDRRTGKVSIPTDRIDSYYNVRVACNREKQTVEVQLQRDSIVFQFTDQPPPPEPAKAKAEPGKPAVGPTEAKDPAGKPAASPNKTAPGQRGAAPAGKNSPPKLADALGKALLPALKAFPAPLPAQAIPAPMRIEIQAAPAEIEIEAPLVPQPAPKERK